MRRMMLGLAWMVVWSAGSLAAQGDNPYSLAIEAEPDSVMMADSGTHSPARASTPTKSMRAIRYARKPFNPAFRVSPSPARSQSEYLQSAGYHWLTSIGLGLGAGAVAYITDLDGVGPQAMFWGLAAGSFGFSIAVPIDLILAGNQPKNLKP